MIFTLIALPFILTSKPHWERVVVVDLPKRSEPGSVGYDSRSKNFLVFYDLPNGFWDPYFYLSSQKRYVGLGRCHGVGNFFDSGAGLFDTVSNYQDPRTRDFVQYSDGKKVGSVRYQGQMWRIGRVLQTEQEFTDLNGRLLWRSAPPSFEKSTPGYLGRLIWDGTRRLAIIGKDDKPNDVKEVVDILPGWKKGKRVWLSNYAMGFSRIVGNPDTGAFAVVEESNRSAVCTGVFSRDLRRLISGNVDVMDIGPGGILAFRVKATEFGEFTGASKPFCLDGVTGKVLWHSEKANLMYWMGDKIVANRDILDGKTGKIIGHVPEPSTNFKRQFSLNRGVLVALTHDNRIAVYQLKL